MANQVAQQADLENVLSGLEGLEGLDDLEALDFEVEEVEASADENDILQAAQEEVTEDTVEEESIDDLVDDIEVEAAAEVEPEEDDEADLTEEVEADLKAEERQKKLEEATMTEEEIEKAKSSIASEAKKQKEAKKEAKPSAPREPSEKIDCQAMIEHKVSPAIDAWKWKGGMSDDDAVEHRDNFYAVCDDLPKKTREKVVNLMDWYVRGRTLSVYTEIALQVLVEQEEISSADLRNRYMSNPGKSYSQGTANAQTGQVMQILKTFGLISETGKINADHAMIECFKLKSA